MQVSQSEQLPKLPAGWKWIALEELCERVSVGHVGETSSHFTDSDGIKFLRSQNVRPGRVELHDIKHVSKSFHLKSKKSQLQQGDILVVRVGHNRGDCAVLPRGLGDVNCANIVFARLKDTKFSDYVGYFLNTKLGRSLLLAVSTGSAQAVLNTKSVAKVLIPKPPVEEAKIIGDWLKIIDDKIVLNQQTNKTLEQMAQVLFKSWFVDFNPVMDNALAAGNPIPGELTHRVEVRKKAHALPDFQPLPEHIRNLFPSEFEQTGEPTVGIGGCTPKDWTLGELSDLMVLQRGFDLPKHSRTDGEFPLMAASGQDGTHNQSKVAGPGVVTGRSGKLGVTTFVNEDFWPLNTTLWIKEYKASNPYHAFFFLQSLPLEEFNSGSAVPTLNRNHIHNYKCYIPSINVTEAFKEIISKYFTKLSENSKQNTRGC